MLRIRSESSFSSTFDGVVEHQDGTQNGQTLLEKAATAFAETESIRAPFADGSVRRGFNLVAMRSVDDPRAFLAKGCNDDACSNVWGGGEAQRGRVELVRLAKIAKCHEQGVRGRERSRNEEGSWYSSGNSIARCLASLTV